MSKENIRAKLLYFYNTNCFYLTGKEWIQISQKGLIKLWELFAFFGTQNRTGCLGVHKICRVMQGVCCRCCLLGVQRRVGGGGIEGNSTYVQFCNTSWLIGIAMPFPLNPQRTSGSHYISLFSALCDTPWPLKPQEFWPQRVKGRQYHSTSHSSP